MPVLKKILKVKSQNFEVDRSKKKHVLSENTLNFDVTLTIWALEKGAKVLKHPVWLLVDLELCPCLTWFGFKWEFVEILGVILNSRSSFETYIIYTRFSVSRTSRKLGLLRLILFCFCHCWSTVFQFVCQLPFVSSLYKVPFITAIKVRSKTDLFGSRSTQFLL